jgi:hypothetical protein
MDLDDALDQLGAIHAHLARSETYRGYRPAAVAFSGAAGLAAALAQPWAVPADEPLAFVRYWLLIAAGCAVIGGGVTVLGYFTREDEFARRRTRIVLGQFLPCLVVGGALTLALSRHGGANVVLLPGLWSLVFGLGTVSSLPYLPRAAGWVAVWYLAAGLLLLLAVDGPVPAGWSVGVAFGLGQLLSAVALSQARPGGEP